MVEQFLGKSSAPVWDLLINATGFAGIICLSVPAWYANKYGRLIARLLASRVPYLDSEMQDLQKQAAESLEELRDQWTIWKSNLLIAGTLLTMGSYGLGVLKAFLDLFASF